MSAPDLPESWTEARLQNLIANRIKEHHQLEYKSGRLLTAQHKDVKDEMTKDVSAFANASGGTIIFGIDEGNGDESHMPVAISPIDRAVKNREWFDQILGQIQPKIEGLIIHDVSIASKPTCACYVVEVPQSNTAHQALDGRYHRRNNITTERMLDYEIRDVMNRQVHPSVEAHVRLTTLNGNTIFQIRVSNTGRILAKHYVVKVFVPFNVGCASFLASEQVDFEAIQDRYWHASFPKISDVCRPLFPGEEIFRNIAIHTEPHYGKSAPEPSKFKEIICTLYADNMPFKEKRIDAASLGENFQ